MEVTQWGPNRAAKVKRALPERLRRMDKERNFLMVTVSGKDRPGITAAFSRVLVEHHVELVDIEQASPQDLLGLYFLLDLKSAAGGKDNVIKDLLFEASKLDLNLQFGLFSADQARPGHNHDHHVLTFFGGAAALAVVSAILGEEDVNIEKIATHTLHGARSVEMNLSLRSPENLGRLKKRLMLASRESGFDMALQRMEAFRKNKRLIFFDMDSTLLDMEVIDELAERAGVGRQVARVTEKAMRGDLDFEDSLRQRAALLKGLPEREMADIRDHLKYSPGARELVASLKWLGYKTGVVTGGFAYFAEHLKKELGLDFAFANRLEIKDGKLTGKVLGEVVDAAGKAKTVSDIACAEGVHLDQVVVVGDGANDALMLGQAGLGIAYNAKRALDKVANVALGKAGLANILHLLGVTEEDVDQARGC